MNSARSHCFFVILILLFLTTSLTVAQSGFVDPEVARACGCTLRKWPLLSDFVSKKAPSLIYLQPDTVLPHYSDAGCLSGPRLPSEGVYGNVRFTQLASLDLFIDHDWHDFNLFVKFDGEAYYLNSIANSKNNNSFLCYDPGDKGCSVKGETLMEVEWDTKHYPERFWGSAGDRVWMTGRYIWDCGHPNGYHTEIHPPHALALTRLEPQIFAGDNSPSLTNKTYVYIHGKSGMKDYNFKTVQGVESVIFNGYRDAAVANRDYEFDVPLPPKPAGYRGQATAEVSELPFGGPRPELSIDPSQKFMHVKYPLKLSDSSPERKFGAIIISGWRAPISAVRFRKLRIHVEQIQILKPHNVVSLSDWKLWLNINGQWTELKVSPQSESSLPFGVDRLLNVDRLLGTSIPAQRVERDFQVIVPETNEARLTIQVAGWVNFYDDLFGAREDLLNSLLRMPAAVPQVFSQVSTREGRVGIFFRQFSRADNFGIGNHNASQESYKGELSKGFELVDGIPKGGFPKGGYAETDGDFAIAYTITETP